MWRNVQFKLGTETLSLQDRGLITEAAKCNHEVKQNCRIEVHVKLQKW